MAGLEGLPFCGGRTDASNADFSENLAPRDYLVPSVVALRDNFNVIGLTQEQGVALFGRPTSRYPELGSLYNALVTKTFEGPDASGMYTPTDGGNPITAMENALMQNGGFPAIVDEFNGNMASFKTELASAWTHLMTADRFAGQTENLCAGVDDLGTAPSPTNLGTAPSPTTLPATGTGTPTLATAAAGTDAPSPSPVAVTEAPTTSPFGNPTKAPVDSPTAAPSDDESAAVRLPGLLLLGCWGCLCFIRST